MSNRPANGSNAGKVVSFPALSSGGQDKRPVEGSFKLFRLDEHRAHPELRRQVIGLLHKRELLVPDIKRILLIADRYGLHDNPFGWTEPVLRVPAAEAGESAENQLSNLIEAENFISGAAIDPLAFVQLARRTEFRDFISSIRSLEIQSVGIIYPLNRSGLEWQWRILFKE